MGIARLFGLGNKNKAAISMPSVVLGEDKTKTQRNLESTGVYLLDQRNRLGYDSFPDAIASCFEEQKNGTKKYLGQTCVIFEPMSRPWDFKKCNWVDKDLARKKEVILESARSEGYSRAIQEITDEDQANRMQTALLLLIGIMGVLALLYVFQSGLIQKIMGH